MTGLDTNVIVRYLTQDDPAQARRASRLIDRSATSGETLHVSTIVLCEVVWVLRGAYKVSKSAVIEALERMLGTPQLDIEDRDLVRRAVGDYGAGRADFADYLIGRRNESQGCSKTVTFDTRLRRHPAFQVLAAAKR